MVKNIFYFILNTFVSVKIFLFGFVGKQLHRKAKVNFKIYDTTDWETNNHNTHIAQYLKKERQSGNETW